MNESSINFQRRETLFINVEVKSINLYDSFIWIIRIIYIVNWLSLCDRGNKFYFQLIISVLNNEMNSFFNDGADHLNLLKCPGWSIKAVSIEDSLLSEQLCWRMRRNSFGRRQKNFNLLISWASVEYRFSLGNSSG